MRTRREPPPFRRVTVARVVERSPHLRRLTLAGPELAGLEPGLPAASVRLLVPDGDQPAIPTWNGNEFLHADGSRPAIRTLTPLRLDPTGNELDVEVVLHGDGPLSSWAERAAVGATAAVSGTGRGYEIDPAATTFLLAGDETALPAIATILEALPAGARAAVHIEVAHPDARVDLPRSEHVEVTWHDAEPGVAPGSALAGAVAAAPIEGEARIWVAGEAAAVQRIRRHLFDERGIPRPQCTVRGYWKHGRSGGGEDG